jgi:hypothetical protein
VWERPDGSLDGPIRDLLRAGEEVLPTIGPWLKPRPPAPAPGQIRINLLTPSGLYFGQGPLKEMRADRRAQPVVGAATDLMQRLIECAGRTRT